MNSRPLLDYLAYPDETPEPQPAPGASMNMPETRNMLEARLKELEARLSASEAQPTERDRDLTLSAQIETILRRKASPYPADAERATRPVETERPAVTRQPPRVVVDPPPTAPVSTDNVVEEAEFRKFTEAVYLIGQAARRFIEQPQPVAPPQPAPAAPSTGEIETLSAVLRETVSAFRSVADDLAVSVGEIRNLATREERAPQPRRMPPSRFRDEDDEIVELRDGIADLQERLDVLLRARRRTRY